MDLILQDSMEQLLRSERHCPESVTIPLIKPAADNVFKYNPDYIHSDPTYDVFFPANGGQSFKGHEWIYSTIPRDIKMLNLGIEGNYTRANGKRPKNVSNDRQPRKMIPRLMGACKVGIVTVEHEPDSCPRVIPEMLACGLPVIALDRVRFWQEIYLPDGKGVGAVSNTQDFWHTVMIGAR